MNSIDYVMKKSSSMDNIIISPSLKAIQDKFKAWTFEEFDQADS